MKTMNCIKLCNMNFMLFIGKLIIELKLRGELTMSDGSCDYDKKVINNR
jgi:hypothetical protein